jgi:hypothetical protein
MLKRIASIAVLAAVFTVSFSTNIRAKIKGTVDDLSSKGDLTVHEWGTFTSVAGADGRAVEWIPLGGPIGQSDLPCFVNQSQVGIKWLLTGTVRMETPVLYFYAPHEMKVNATVRFPQGTITEWYPQANLANQTIFDPRKTSVLEWRDVDVLPGTNPTLPTESGPSHYYAARQTDAAPVRVKGQDEKFLFYRGVGTFPVPIGAQVESDGRLLLQNLGKDTIPGVILFENRGGKIGYRMQGSLKGTARLDPPTLDGDFASLQQTLEKILIASGLYEKEAKAMVATWRDSWFEEGTRVFYIVPTRAVDSILPLEIEPKPANIARSFVGRLEVITPATENAVANALRTRDQSSLNTYQRFLGPIAKQLLAKSTKADDRILFQDFVTFKVNTAANFASTSMCK